MVDPVVGDVGEMEVGLGFVNRRGDLVDSEAGIGLFRMTKPRRETRKVKAANSRKYFVDKPDSNVGTRGAVVAGCMVVVVGGVVGGGGGGGG